MSITKKYKGETEVIDSNHIKLTTAGVYCEDDIEIEAEGGSSGFPVHFAITEQVADGNYLIINGVKTEMGHRSVSGTFEISCTANKVGTEINDYQSDTNLAYKPTGTSTWLTMPQNTEITINEETDFQMRFGSCLLKGTLILMADGTQRKIEDLFAGDMVQGYYEPVEITRIDSAFKKYADWYDEWFFDDGTILRTCHQHEFYNATKGKYCYLKKYEGEDDSGAGEWEIGDKGLKSDGSTPTLTNHIHHEMACQHFTLFTEDNTYYANGLLSGNRHSVEINNKEEQ